VSAAHRVAASLRAARDNRESGQGLVEFALVLIPFLLLLMAIADLGRGVYTNNGVAQAAREIARATSVHPCNPSFCTLGNSTEALAAIGTQRNLVPGLGGTGSEITITCTSITDAVLSAADCRPGSFVRVTVSVPFRVSTPLLNMVAPSTLSSSTHIQMQ
jgi:Flp pilus assembly protein TadG